MFKSIKSACLATARTQKRRARFVGAGWAGLKAILRQLSAMKRFDYENKQDDEHDLKGKFRSETGRSPAAAITAERLRKEASYGHRR